MWPSLLCCLGTILTLYWWKLNRENNSSITLYSLSKLIMCMNSWLHACLRVWVSTLTYISSWCTVWHSFSWSYDGVCSDTECNNSVGREVPQCVLCGWCVGVVQYSTDVVTDLIHCDDTIGFWGRTPWDSELYHSWCGCQIRYWTRNCTGTSNNLITESDLKTSLLTTLKCLHSECCTIWPSTSIIDCCHLHRIYSIWSQSSQHILSALLSCSVHNGRTIAVA